MVTTETRITMTADELRAELDRAAQARVGRSWASAASAYATGELGATELSDLLVLADLLPPDGDAEGSNDRTR